MSLWTASWSSMPFWGTTPRSCTSWPTCILLISGVICFCVLVKIVNLLQSVCDHQPLTHWLHTWASGRSTTSNSLVDAGHQHKSHWPSHTGQTGTIVWCWWGWFPGFAPLRWGKGSANIVFLFFTDLTSQDWLWRCLMLPSPSGTSPLTSMWLHGSGIATLRSSILKRPLSTLKEPHSYSK